MNPRLIYMVLKNEKTRNIIIVAICLFLLFICLPITYFFVNNPIALGIKAVKNAVSSSDNVNVQFMKANMSQRQFFNTVSAEAIVTHKKSGVFASITLAQAMLESGTGSSGLTRKANNLFGIKAFNWTGKTIQMETTEYEQGMDVSVQAPFRAYDNWNESIDDHTNFLMQNSTYKENGVFTATTYQEQAQALQNAGYATNPDYATLLVTLIKEYNLNKYDAM